MTEEEFKEKMMDVLNCEEAPNMDDKLDDLVGWDSLAYVAYLAMAASYAKKRIRALEVRKAVTVSDLYNLIIRE